MNLTHLKKLNLVEDLPKQLQALWAELHGVQGGAELEQWVDELLYLDHGINRKERDAESARALHQIREEALHKFTHHPGDAEKIYEKICADIQEQVATRATQISLRTAEEGGAADGRGAAHETKFHSFCQAHALLKKCCFRKVFGGK